MEACDELPAARCVRMQVIVCQSVSANPSPGMASNRKSLTGSVGRNERTCDDGRDLADLQAEEHRFADLLEADVSNHLIAADARTQRTEFAFGTAACMLPHHLITEAQKVNGISLCFVPVLALVVSATGFWKMRLPVVLISLSGVAAAFAKLTGLLILYTEERSHHLPFGPSEQYRHAYPHACTEA